MRKSIIKLGIFIKRKIANIQYKQIIKKILAEVLLAGIITLSTYWGSSLYHNISTNKIENQKLSNIYVSISGEYLEQLFGVPQITVKDEEGYINNFYSLKNTILRTVLDNNKVVAYFVTSKNKRSKVPVDSFETEKRILGKVTYSDITFPNPITDVSFAGYAPTCYYYECQGTGRYGMYNYYVYGTSPIGFRDDNSSLLISEIYFNDTSSENIDNLKRKSYPNTFGVISDGYQDTVSFILNSNEWTNVYYMLQ